MPCRLWNIGDNDGSPNINACTVAEDPPAPARNLAVHIPPVVLANSSTRQFGITLVC
jgi:hypothetical protein